MQKSEKKRVCMKPVCERMAQVTPIIFHIDVNSAYLSWTAVEQLKNGAKVDIREIPAIIGGDQTSRHGVVLAKSTFAKKYGIRTGEPVANAFRKCPNLVMYPPDHRMYREKSRQMMEYLKTFTKEIEQVSVDECYMDFTKIAARYSSPIKDLYMAGKSSVQVLKKLEINTIGALAQADPDLISLHLKSHGRMLWEFANGIGTSTVQSEPEEAKGIGNSTTLREDARTMEEVCPVFEELAQSVGRRLKKAGKKAGMVSAEIKYYDFRTLSHQMQLEKPSNESDIICKAAVNLFREVWTGEPVRLLGIRTSKLSDENEPEQLTIFDMKPEAEPDEKHKRLRKAMDELNKKYGEGAVIKASLMPKKK